MSDENKRVLSLLNLRESLVAGVRKQAEGDAILGSCGLAGECVGNRCAKWNAFDAENPANGECSIRTIGTLASAILMGAYGPGLSGEENEKSVLADSGALGSDSDASREGS